MNYNIAVPAGIRSWMSGFFDGEGCVNIHPRRRVKSKLYKTSRVMIKIGNTDEDSLWIFAKYFGGEVQGGLMRKDKPKCKPMFRWTCPGRTQKIFLTSIFLFSITKRVRIALALEFLKTVSPGDFRHRLNNEEMELREDCIIKMRELNAKGVRYAL